MKIRGVVKSILVMLIGGCCIASNTFGEELRVVEFLFDPDIRTIDLAAPQPVTIIAHPSKDDVTYRWKLDGVGSLAGNAGDAGQIYLPPQDMQGDMTQATISVVVADKQGNTATMSVTLTLKKTQESNSKNVELSEHAPSNAAELARLLQACAQHVQANRLTTGRGGNATDCYEEVLKLDPANSEALTGLANIAVRYVELIQQALQKHDLKKAQQLLASLRTLNPESPKLAELEATIKDQESSASLWDAAVWNQSRWQ